MTFQEIDTTTDHGTYKGDPAKTAFDKINENFGAAAKALSFLRGGSGLTNLLINPSLLVNQRRFAGGGLAANVFGYDRWFAGAGGANVAVSAAGVITHASGTVCQAVEAPQNTMGTVVRVSVSDLSGGNLNVTAAGVSGVITPGAGRRSVAIQLPIGTASGNVLVTLNAAGVTYRNIMLARTDEADGRFDASQFGLELFLCKQFWEKSYNYNVRPGTADRVGSYRCGILNGFFLAAGSIPFAVEKRGLGAVTIYAARDGTVGNGSEVNSGGVFVANRVVTAANIGTSQFQAGGTNTLTAGSTIEFHWVNDSEITQ